MSMSIRALIASVSAASVAFLAACAPLEPPEPVPAPLPAEPEAVEALPAPLPEPYDTKTLRTRSNLRAEPSTHAEVVGTFDAGTQIGLLDLKDGWYHVRIDTTLGWVYAPLVEMSGSDRFVAAISYMAPRLQYADLFTAQFQSEDGLTIILDIAWRDLSDARKLRVVEQTGEAWKDATGRMGIEPPPAIRFVSNNDVEMASWHGFWGAQVRY
jgi:hypothetical protein